MSTPEIQSTIQALVKELQSNPIKYEQLRQDIQNAASDEEKANILVGFATNDARINEMVPEDISPAAIGTVTVTTVLTPAGPVQDDI